MRSVFLSCALFASLVSAADKPAITFKAPPSTDEDRPVLTQIVVGPQGGDFGFKLEFNKEPWGEDCKTRCANATIFLDTDNNKITGLKLPDTKAAETGADLAIIIQGVRELKGQSTLPVLKIKVKQFNEEAVSIEQGSVLAEFDPASEPERVLAQDTSVYLLVDANIGSLPIGPKVRVVYHPPDAKPLVGYGTGLGAPGASRVEVFKDGKLTNPPPKPKRSSSGYEKY